MENFDPFFTGIFVAWIGYQAQSIISINQLGLAVWGWGLGGLVAGYSLLETEASPIDSARTSKRSSKSKIRPNLLLPAIGGLLGFLSVYPMFAADHNSRVALESRNANLVFAAAIKEPLDLNRTLNAAQLLASNHFTSRALDLTKRIVLENPKSYTGWVLLSQITPLESSDHKQAIKQMQKLNPRDKNIK